MSTASPFIASSPISPKRAAVILLVGMTVSLVCLSMWTSLLVLSRVNFSFLALPVAALVGWSIRRAGAQGDMRFALLASVFTLASCHFGAGFAARILEARLIGSSALELIYGATPGDLFMAVSVNICDLAFYALAACVAWRQVCPPAVSTEETTVTLAHRGRTGQII